MPVEPKSVFSDIRTILVAMLVVQMVTAVTWFYLLSYTSDYHFRVSSEAVQTTSSTSQRDNESRNTATASDTTTVASTTVASTTVSANVSETLRRYSEIFIPRSNWSPPDFYVPCNIPLQLPVNKIYVREIVSTNCYNYDECKTRALERERFYYWYYETDIQGNFMFGGDGSIFEAMSWTCKVTYFVPDPNSILVLLVGCSECGGSDGKQNNFKKIQYTSLEVFIQANIISGNLSPSYQLMPYCCIYPGRNPTQRVYTHLSYIKNFNGSECVEKRYCQYSN